MLKKKMIPLLMGSCLLMGALSTAALAEDAKALFATCTACHGKDGKSPIMPNYPKIAGQNKAYVLQQIKDIMSGARANGQAAAMKGVLVSPDGKPRFNDQQLEALADYVSKLAP